MVIEVDFHEHLNGADKGDLDTAKGYNRCMTNNFSLELETSLNNNWWDKCVCVTDALKKIGFNMTWGNRWKQEILLVNVRYKNGYARMWPKYDRVKIQQHLTEHTVQCSENSPSLILSHLTFFNYSNRSIILFFWPCTQCGRKGGIPVTDGTGEGASSVTSGETVSPSSCVALTEVTEGCRSPLEVDLLVSPSTAPIVVI